MRSSWTIGAFGLILAAGAAIALTAASGASPGPAETSTVAPAETAAPKLPPFLELFKPQPIEVESRRVEWTTATGRAAGYLARRADDERLPALILIPGRGEPTAWHRRSARELAEIGYVVLLVDPDGPLPPLPRAAATARERMAAERALARLGAAARWLRRRDDVFPDRLGALGWKAGGVWAWRLAAAASLQAAVNIDGPVPENRPLVPVLRHTAVMGLWGTAGEAGPSRERRKQFAEALQSAEIEHALHAVEGARPGFMIETDGEAYHADAADHAWFVTYEFLGEHVEDVHIKRLLAKRRRDEGEPGADAATIAELMRSVNSPEGLRGQLIRRLNAEPRDDADWRDVAARAAVMVETGNVLLQRDPRRGGRADWLKHAGNYREAAVALRRAAQAHDAAAARESLQRIGESCGACHLDHR